MITTPYYCPRCGWRMDVADAADVPHCRDCNGALLPLDDPTATITGLRVGEAKGCDGRANPMYPRGEG